MAYSSEFIALCNDPFGEAMTVRVYVRLNDSGGQPGTLVELTATQELLDLNPIEFRRERQFGVVQGQVWQLRLSNTDRALMAYELKECWLAIRAGFPAADVWETMAQGRIKKVTWSAAGSVTIDVADTVMDLLNYTMPRDTRYQESNGWVSQVQSETVASASRGYDSSVSLFTASSSTTAPATRCFGQTGRRQASRMSPARP